MGPFPRTKSPLNTSPEVRPKAPFRRLGRMFKGLMNRVASAFVTVSVASLRSTKGQLGPGCVVCGPEKCTSLILATSTKTQQGRLAREVALHSGEANVVRLTHFVGAEVTHLGNSWRGRPLPAGQPGRGRRPLQSERLQGLRSSRSACRLSVIG